MNICSLAEIGTRLDEATALLPGEPAGPAEFFDRYESVAIAILDSEHMDFAQAPQSLLQLRVDSSTMIAI